MNNLKSDEKKCEESEIEDNGVWRWEQLRTRGGNRRKGKFSTERRHKETEPNRSRGKTFTGAGKREVCEYRKGKVRERKTSRERAGKKKVRQGDGKCSGEKGYLCLGVVGAAGRLLKASHVQAERERELESGCLKDVWQNKEPKIAPLDCPENHILKMNFRTAPNNL